MMEYGFDFGIYGLISTIVNLVLGGGSVVMFLTIRSQKRKAKADALQTEANAEGTQIDNANKVVEMYEKMAEKLEKQLNDQDEKSKSLNDTIERLTKQVEKLNCINSKIYNLLDKLSHDNLEETRDKMKKILKNED